MLTLEFEQLFHSLISGTQTLNKEKFSKLCISQGQCDESNLYIKQTLINTLCTKNKPSSSLFLTHNHLPHTAIFVTHTVVCINIINCKNSIPMLHKLNKFCLDYHFVKHTYYSVTMSCLPRKAESHRVFIVTILSQGIAVGPDQLLLLLLAVKF